LCGYHQDYYWQKLSCFCQFSAVKVVNLSQEGKKAGLAPKTQENVPPAIYIR
jgi:hypothetical protein